MVFFGFKCGYFMFIDVVWFNFFFVVQDEVFLEDINMIFNMGDVLNIYELDEKVEIIEQVKECVQSCDFLMRFYKYLFYF